MSEMIVDDFLKPLLDLFAKPRGSIVALAEALAEDCPSVTKHQLQQAVKSLRQTWKYSTFPSPSACVSAIRAAPTSEFVPSGPRCDEESRPRSPAPALVSAERFVADFEAAGDARRAELERWHPGRYQGSLAMIRAFGGGRS